MVPGAITKRRVEKLTPTAAEELIKGLLHVRETLDMALIKALLDSLTRPLELAMEKSGERIPAYS
jgi:hypothetical protein